MFKWFCLFIISAQPPACFRFFDFCFFGADTLKKFYYFSIIRFEVSSITITKNHQWPLMKMVFLNEWRHLAR